jgi:protein-S-isoprenylcysteine O-methyltransferase Ste14
MTAVLFTIGGLTAAVLISALLMTLIYPSLRIWPPPAARTWQSYLFWPAFRGLNVLCFATAISDYTAGFLGLPVAIRAAALALLVASLLAFIYAFRVLGRDNSYCAQDGLVARGIYRWSRNPQNAMLMLVYGSLAVAADSGPAYLLCAAMMTSYALMVLAEEPWLREVYGASYRSYCRSVPRFFNWRRAALTIRARLQRLTRATLCLPPVAHLADHELLVCASACI